MIGRSRQILSRLPAHLEATRPGKVLGMVVDAPAQDLDVLAARLAAVRRSHRLGEADELVDLLLIAAYHGISAGELELLFMRFARARELAAVLDQAADDPARDAAAEELCNLWSLSAPHPRLPLYAPRLPGGGALDLQAAKTRLLDNVAAVLRYDRLVDLLRTRIGRVCQVHAQGNGTVQALMEGAAIALDLEMGPLVTSVDRFWHAVPVYDRHLLTRPVPKLDKDGQPTAEEVPEPFAVAEELLGLEENPLWRATTDSTGRRHGELWSLTRRGFERALTQIRITGTDGRRSIGPMVVNRDEGHGVGFVGTVPPSKTLIFTEEGRALLDGLDMTSFAYAWQGACFAGIDLDTKLDFVFDGPGLDPKQRPARFVTTTPANALDREAVYPHADVSLPMPGVAVGVTRLAFFAQEAHFNSLEGIPESPIVRLVTPRSNAAIIEGSVFAPEPGTTRQVAAEVALSWLEHRAFSVRLLIPARFHRLEDDAEGTEVRRRVALAVERFRPVGIELKVEFIDDRWVLGEGVLTTGEGADAIEKLRSAMVLWEAPAEEADA